MRKNDQQSYPSPLVGNNPDSAENAYKGCKWIKILISSMIVSLASIATIVGTIWAIEKTREPRLHVTVKCENWKDPNHVELELKGMHEVSNLCKRLEKVIDPNLNVEFPDVNDLSCKMIKEIDELEPCEANTARQLRSMYSIRVQNKGHRKSEHVILTFEDAKYIEYKKEGEDKRIYRERRFVDMNDLSPTRAISIKAWATCPVSRLREFHISQDFGPYPSYRTKTPVRKSAAWANLHPKVCLAFILFSVGLLCIFAYSLALTQA